MTTGSFLYNVDLSSTAQLQNKCVCEALHIFFQCIYTIAPIFSYSQYLDCNFGNLLMFMFIGYGHWLLTYLAVVSRDLGRVTSTHLS
jgi:hypothetical protein